MQNSKQCPCCKLKSVGPIRTWRRLSAYYDESLNYMKSCLHCIRLDDYYLKYDWHEYYCGQGYGQTESEFKKELNQLRSPKEYEHI